MSPLADAQSLRQRYGRLSLVQLGIYGLVSVGSHVLLLSLLRWAWQVQIAAQPVGKPAGIEFIEVDLSDRAFADQLPDESTAPLASGERLTAAQLNALIAQGQTAEQVAELDSAVSDAASGLSDERSQNTSPTALPDSAERSEVATGAEPENNSTALNQDNRASLGGEADTELPAAAGPDETTEPETAASATAPQPSGTSAGNPTVSDAEKLNGTETEDESKGPLNPLPPNSNSQPLPPNQLPDQSNAGTTAPEAGQSGSGSSPDPTKTGSELSHESGTQRPETEAENPNKDEVSTDTSSSDTGASSDTSGSEIGSAETGASPDAGASSDFPDESGQPDAGEDVTSPDSQSDGSDTVPRLGANLVVDEVESRKLNTRDVFDRLPRPIGDPLANGQPVGSGRCSALLATLTPTSYGQPVRLRIAVGANGDVLTDKDAVKGIGPNAQAPVGQAIICLVKAWPFEPAQRILNGEIEPTGAELFVTVTISLLD